MPEEVQYIANETDLENIAIAIRDQSHKVAFLSWPQDFIDEIEALEGTPDRNINKQHLVSGIADSNINRGDKVHIYMSAAAYHFEKASVIQGIPILRYDSTYEGFGYALKNMEAHTSYNNSVYWIVNWSSYPYDLLTENSVASIATPKISKKRSTKKSNTKNNS